MAILMRTYPANMAIVTVCNHKGGTGKTTSVINLAAALGHAGLHVLVVDLDPQGFLTRMLGVDEPHASQTSLALFHAEGDLRSIAGIQMSGFTLIPASYAMTKALRSLNKPTDVFWLKEILADGHDYDLILFDTAAAITVYSMNALVASDLVLIPVTPEYQPVVGAEQTYGTARLVSAKLNPTLGEPVFLLTQLDARKRDHAAYGRYLREKYGERVLKMPIRTSAALAETSRMGQTVFDRDTTSRGALDYSGAADELMSVLDNPDSLAAAPMADAPSEASFRNPPPARQPASRTSAESRVADNAAVPVAVEWQ
jgi:chromosome partitioning protein